MHHENVLQCDKWFLLRCLDCRSGLAMRILSVRLSVRLSVKRVHCVKTERRSVKIFLYHTKDQWWGRPLIPEILGQSDRVGAKSPIFHLFLLVRPSEKGSIKSTTRFPMSPSCDNSETARDRMSFYY